MAAVLTHRRLCASSVADEMVKEVAIEKERRKAREARAARGSPKKGAKDKDPPIDGGSLGAWTTVMARRRRAAAKTSPTSTCTSLGWFRWTSRRACAKEV